jgi:predicted polyphosphate/ATP-dependent NAD kinase
VPNAPLDIFEIVSNKLPILGIPSGVKMHSGVFGVNTSASARMLHEFVNKHLTIGDVEIMDLNEVKGKFIRSGYLLQLSLLI